MAEGAFSGFRPRRKAVSRQSGQFKGEYRV